MRGFLGGGSEPPPHQLEGLGSAVGSPSGVLILGPQKSRQNGQLAFECGEGQQVNLGASAPAPT